MFRDGGAGLEEDYESLGPNTVKNDKIVWFKYNPPCQHYSEFLPVGAADIIHITLSCLCISMPKLCCIC